MYEIKKERNLKDILGRTIKDYDIVVAKGTGRDVVRMTVGVWRGKSIVYGNGGKRSVGDVFLVEHPGEKELEIKNRLIRILKEEDRIKQQKAKTKCMSLHQLEIGGIYKGLNQGEYVYLGKKTVTVEKCNMQGKWEMCSEEFGNCFVSIYGRDDINCFISRIKEVDVYGKHNVDVLKSNKKLIQKIGKIEIPDEIIGETEFKNMYWGSLNGRWRLTIK